MDTEAVAATATVKTCEKCFVEYDKKEHFYSGVRTRDGYDTACKGCRKKEREKHKSATGSTDRIAGVPTCYASLLEKIPLEQVWTGVKLSDVE